MKIFGIGLIKTGTTSLGQALGLMGFGHCTGSGLIGNQLVGHYISGNLQPIFDFVQAHDSFEDFPFCARGLYKHLDNQFPNSKFILTVRDPESWYSSLLNYFRPAPTESSSLLVNSKNNSELPIGGLYGLINYMLATFGTIDLADKDKLLEGFNKHNTEVQIYFKSRPDDLLVVNWTKGDGWKELSDFLGVPVSSCAFPHANRNPRKH